MRAGVPRGKAALASGSGKGSRDNAAGRATISSHRDSSTKRETYDDFRSIQGRGKAMRMTTRVLAAALPVLLTISTAAAAPTPESCKAGKLKALSKAQKANLNCYMKYHANPDKFDISGCRLRLFETLVIKLEKA